MKTKLIETTFSINEEKRTIACIITTRNDVLGTLEKYEGLSAYEKYQLDPPEYMDKLVFVGIAKCSPEDKWDVNYGMRLAEFRAQVKRTNYHNKKIAEYLHSNRETLNRIEKYGYLKYPRYPQKKEV